MPAPSQFSTKERLDSINKILDQIDVAINEAKIAAEAGVPTAAEQLKTLEEQQAKVLQLKNTYFPTGTAASG